MSDLDALDPTPEEIAGLTAPLRPQDVRMAADWTAPTPEEIGRLVRRAHPLPRRPGRIGPVLAMAALLLLQLQPTPPAPVLSPVIPPAVTYMPPVVPVGTSHQLAAPVALGPSIVVTGSGEVRLLTAGESGTALSLETGTATFEVDPAGDFRSLLVHVGDVTVIVTGTRFTVEADPIAVSVARGSVRILHPGGQTALSSGGHWLRVEPILEPDIEAPPPPERLAMSPPEDTALAAPLAWSALLNDRDAGADPATLLHQVDGFIATWPDSPLVEEVSAWRLTLLTELYPSEVITADVDDWLATWPGSHRRGEVLLLRATLSRQAGDCVVASAYYRAVLAEPAPPLHEPAQQWLDWCSAQ